MNIKKILAFSIGPIGGATLGFITLPIITWFYSAEDVGRIAMLQVISSFCILLFSLGLDQAYVREYHEVENKPALLKVTLLPGLLLLLLMLAVCLSVPAFISTTLFAVDSIQISLLMALYLVSAFASRFLSLILRMQERGLAYSMSQVLPKFLFLTVIGGYILLSFGFDFLHLVIAHSVSGFAVVVIYAWNTRKEWLASLRQEVDFKKMKSMLRFGAPLIIGGVAYWGLTAMDKVFLRGLSTFEELGIYSVATSFAAVGIIFQSIFSTVWAPTVYKWAAEGINAEKISHVREYVLLVVMILFSLAGLFSWCTAYFLPEKYENVQYLLVVCMAAPLFYTLSETTVVGLGIARKSSYAMLASIIAVLSNLLGNYLLIPIYGAVGAAISTALAFWLFLFFRTEFASLVWRRIPRLKLYIATSACLVLAIGFGLFGYKWPVYFLILWLVLLCVAGFIGIKRFLVIRPMAGWFFN